MWAKLRFFNCSKNFINCIFIISFVFYSEALAACSCGIKNASHSHDNTTNNEHLVKIIGGEEAKEGEFNWRCFLKTRGMTNAILCGCAIISRNFIVTAGHCVNLPSILNPSFVNVYVGTNSLRSKEGVEAAQIIRHRSFRLLPTVRNDIALIKLSRPLDFDDDDGNIGPVCLPWNFRNTNFDNEIVTASAWGQTQNGRPGTGTPSESLLKIETQVLNVNQCASKHWQLLFRVSRNNNICTLTSGKGLCGGDSGTTLDWKSTNSGKYFSLGIASFLIDSCGKENSPEVHTKITSYLDWIRSNTGSEEFCESD